MKNVDPLRKQRRPYFNFLIWPLISSKLASLTLMVYTHYASIPFTHLNHFITNPSFMPAPNIRYISIQNPIIPPSSSSFAHSCSFSYNITDPFSAVHPLPRHSRHHLCLPHSFSLTSEHTLSSIRSVCPLNSATHCSYFCHAASFHSSSFSSFHPSVLSTHSSSLC